MKYIITVTETTRRVLTLPEGTGIGAFEAATWDHNRFVEAVAAVAESDVTEPTKSTINISLGS